MYTLVSRVHMTFYVLTKGYTVPENQGTYDKLNQIRGFNKSFELYKLFLISNSYRSFQKQGKKKYSIKISRLKSKIRFYGLLQFIINIINLKGNLQQGELWISLDF